MVSDYDDNSTYPCTNECTPQLKLPPSHPPPPKTTVFNQIAPLTPRLYLAAATALSPTVLDSLSISLVINVTKELPILPVDGARTVRISVGDDTSTNLYSYFEYITTLIREEEEQGGVVLVHCVAGVSRSATICLAYLTKYYGSLYETWCHVRTIRPWVRPNYYFMEQLLQWEGEVRPNSEGTIMERLVGVERGRGRTG